MRAKDFTVAKVVLVLLIFFSIVPDIGIRFATFGFTWTAYRFMIAVSVLFVAISGSITISRRRPSSKWLLFMLIWTLYGFLLLFCGKYTEFHKGFIEWLSLLNGTVVIYVMSRLLAAKQNRELADTIIFFLLNGLVAFGFVEILSGWHWSSSAFCDPNSSIYLYNNRHLATGLMYNMNDFSAMITCMSPVLLNRRFGIFRLFTFSGILIINLINDATTCTLAIFVFLVYYWLLLKREGKSKIIQEKVLLWGGIIAFAFFAFYERDFFAGQNSFLGAFFRQVNNAKRSSGSLFRRITIYKDAISTLGSSGMFGMGPSGFSKYFTLHPSTSKLVNPHGLVFEVLTQYGLMIGIWFIGLLAWMFIKAQRQYKFSNDVTRDDALKVVAFVIVYFFASFAPSTFIGYSYQWLLIALACAHLSDSHIVRYNNPLPRNTALFKSV